MQRVMPKRAIVIVLSDFLDLDFERSLRRLGGRHDVVAIAVHDPREERFPPGALARVVDSENGRMRLIDLGGADVARRASQRQQQIARRWRTAGVDSLAVSTAMPYDRELLRFFRQRVQRVP